jgi:hypothetical protein
MDFLLVIGSGLLLTVRVIASGLFAVASAILSAAVRAVASRTFRGSECMAVPAEIQTTHVSAMRAISVSVDEIAAHLEAREGPTTVMVNNHDPADRIERVVLGDVAVLFARVYYGGNVIKQELRIRCSELKYLLQTNLLLLPEVPFDPKRPIKRTLEKLAVGAQEHLEAVAHAATVGAPRRKATQPRDDEQSRKAPQVSQAPERVVQAQNTPEAPSAHPAPQPANQARNEAGAPAGKLVVPTIKTGYTYEGKLLEAGSALKHPPGREPYKTFEATILMENGAELPLRGAELERALQRAEANIGDRIAVTPMGKIPVTLAGGKEGAKNLYAVVNLSNKRG